MQNTDAKPGLWSSLVLFAAVVLLAMAVENDAGRLLFGVALGVAAVLLYRQTVQLHALEQRLRQLEQAGQVSQSGQTAPPQAAAAAPSIPVRALDPQAQVVAPPPLAAAIPPPAPRQAPPPLSAPLQPRVERSPTLADRGWQAFMAWLRRGNPLARAGVVTLFFGGSFLAKYAAEHSMFPLELRLAALGAGALVLLGVGWRLRSRQPLYAQTLQGGGIAGFYLTVFAATRLYHLLPQLPALALMVVVALGAAVLAVAQDALALAVIGTSGGFLAPILLSTGGGSLVALFSYYTVLNLGVFTVAWFRSWRVLNLVGFVFTFGVAGLFRATAYTAQQQPTLLFFLWLFFLLYIGVTVLFSLRQKPDLKGYVSASLVFGLPLAVFSLHASALGHHGFALAWSALGLGLFYLILAFALLRTRIDNLRLLTEAFAALGAIFATLAIPLAFDGSTTASAWAVEGAGMVWLGVRQQRKLARAFGVLLQLAAAYGWLQAIDSASRLLPAQPLLNGLYLGTLTLAFADLSSATWLYRKRDTLAPYEAGLDSAAVLWGLGWWLGGGLYEITQYAAASALGGCLAFTAASAATFCWWGGRLQWPLQRQTALGLLPPAAMIGVAAAFHLGHPLAEAGGFGWLALLAAGWWMLSRFDLQPDAKLRRLQPGLHAACLLLLCLLVAWEADWQIRQRIGGVWPLLPWGVVPALGLALLGRAKLLPAWPLARHEHSYRLYAGAPLSLLGAAWIVLANLGSSGDPRELPYLPLFNPLDLSVLLLLLAQLRHWLSLAPPLRDALLQRQDQHLLPGAAAALVFLWLNAALVRALHYLAGTPIDFDGVFRSITVQASVSVFWGLLGFAAMSLAARRRQRTLWLAGAVLMAVLLAKLFLVDTAGRGTLARIVSFMIVGALLLITGYLSPLPPRDAASAGPHDEVTP